MVFFNGLERTMFVYFVSSVFGFMADIFVFVFGSLAYCIPVVAIFGNGAGGCTFSSSSTEPWNADT